MSETRRDMRQFVGWFDDAEQDVPVHDPRWAAPDGLGDCIVCVRPLTDDNVRTVSVMWEDRQGGRSLFYRMHQTCGDGLTQREHALYDEAALEAFASGHATEDAE